MYNVLISGVCFLNIGDSPKCIFQSNKDKSEVYLSKALKFHYNFYSKFDALDTAMVHIMTRATAVAEQLSPRM